MKRERKITRRSMNSPLAKYPSLPFDSHFIRDLRRMVQKPKGREEFWAFYVLRPISIYFTCILSRVSPNLITILGIVSILLASWSFVRAEIFWGCILFHISYLFDCVDGEVARWRKRVSRNGKLLDMILNLANIPCFIAFLFGIQSVLSNRDLVLDIGWSALFTISFFATFLTHLAKKTQGFDSGSYLRRKNFLFDLTAFLFSPPGLYTVSIPFALLRSPKVGILYFLTVIYVLGFTAKTLIRSFLLRNSFGSLPLPSQKEVLEEANEIF